MVEKTNFATGDCQQYFGLTIEARSYKGIDLCHSGKPIEDAAYCYQKERKKTNSPTI